MNSLPSHLIFALFTGSLCTWYCACAMSRHRFKGRPAKKLGHFFTKPKIFSLIGKQKLIWELYYIYEYGSYICKFLIPTYKAKESLVSRKFSTSSFRQNVLWFIFHWRVCVCVNTFLEYVRIILVYSHINRLNLKPKYNMSC